MPSVPDESKFGDTSNATSTVNKAEMNKLYEALWKRQSEFAELEGEISLTKKGQAEAQLLRALESKGVFDDTELSGFHHRVQRQSAIFYRRLQRHDQPFSSGLRPWVGVPFRPCSHILVRTELHHLHSRR